MQQSFNNYSYPNTSPVPIQASPNAVNINIVSPQAYAGAPNYNVNNAPSNVQPVYPAYSPIYSQYPNANMAYPYNYNNNIAASNPSQPTLNATNEANLLEKTPNPAEAERKKTDDAKAELDKEEKKKIKTVLTDDYIKSLENYLDNDNPKVRLIGAKELLERFKEDDTRKDNPSLVALLNKTLRDTSPSVRFLGLTMLQTGYTTGNDETISILKEIQSSNKDGLGDDALRASEILLNSALPKMQEVK